MIQHIQLRRDIAANWTANNPILLSGEAGIELDTGKIKFGDGATAWITLPYFQTEAQENNYGRLMAFMGG